MAGCCSLLRLLFSTNGLTASPAPEPTAWGCRRSPPRAAHSAYTAFRTWRTCPTSRRTDRSHPSFSCEAGTVQRGRAQETKAKTRLLEATGSLPEVTNLRSMRTAGGARPGDGGWSLGGSAGRGAVGPAGSPQNAPRNTLPSQEALQPAGKTTPPVVRNLKPTPAQHRLSKGKRGRTEARGRAGSPRTHRPTGPERAGTGAASA